VRCLPDTGLVEAAPQGPVTRVAAPVRQHFACEHRVRLLLSVRSPQRSRSRNRVMGAADVLLAIAVGGRRPVATRARLNARNSLTVKPRWLRLRLGFLGRGLGLGCAFPGAGQAVATVGLDGLAALRQPRERRADSRTGQTSRRRDIGRRQRPVA
jgi:hypothetical protein